MQNIERFDNLADFIAAADKPTGKGWEGKRNSRIESDSRTEFTHTATYAEAVALAADGWRTGTDEIAARLAIVQANNTSSQTVYDFAGSRPDVGRFLAGAPDCMTRRAMTASTRRPCIDVVVNSSIAGKVKAAELINYGAAIVAAIDGMEAAGYSVALTVGAVSDTKTKTANGAFVTLKKHGDQLDIGRAAFCIAHPSFLRRLMFSYWETRNSVTELSKYAGGSVTFGTITDAPHEARGTVYFGMLSSGFDTMEQARRYVADRIAAQAPELLQAA